MSIFNPQDGLDDGDIIASCQQTRFHILEDKRSSEVSIEELTLSIRPSSAAVKSNKAKGVKAQTVKISARDILVGANLKFKAGVHYGLLGRNGSGKSTLLRALADKIIPGSSLATKIALLQQTSTDKNPSREGKGSLPSLSETSELSALQYIVSNDSTRNKIQAELDILCRGESGPDSNDDGFERISAYRQWKYSQMQQQLAEMQKRAAHSSGARGSQARKELLAFEKQVEEARQRTEDTQQSLEAKECHDELTEATERIAELQLELEEHRRGDLEARALKVLSALSFTAETMHTPLKELSGGWQMRCMLANVLLQDADIMILDEPTNFLDLLGIIWLQKHLVELRLESSKTVIVVSHDRDFIDHVCQEICLIKDQSLVYFDGNLSAYEEDLRSRRKNMMRMKDAQGRQAAHMQKTIANNIKEGKKNRDDNRLRQAASRQKRLDDRMGMQVNAKGGKFKLSRDMPGFHASKRETIEIPEEETGTSLSLPLAPDLRFPGALVSLDHVTYSYSQQKTPVLRDINLSIHMGARIGLVGLNGAGKSTLIKLITGINKPTTGTADRHPRLKLGYYSQEMVEDLRAAGKADPSKTALSTLAAEVGEAMDESDIRGLLGSFHLGNVSTSVPVAKLSGGQLVRLALACIVWQHPHLLVLDEVTTHLDFYTVQALSKALRTFNGAVLVVTHDRFFIKSVIEGNAELLGEEDISDEEGEESQFPRSLYLLRKGKLALLENGIREFEEGLESRVEKLFAS